MADPAKAISDPSRRRGRSIGHDFVGLAVAVHGDELTAAQLDSNAAATCRCELTFGMVLADLLDGKDSVCIIWRADQERAGLTDEGISNAIDTATAERPIEA